MKKNTKEGYIYVYKCIVGSRSDVVKIGKTEHFNDKRDRMKQHSRTLYYGFVPYTEFLTGNPISTAFKVNNKDVSDRIVKEAFKEYQLSNIEIYNIEYEDAIEKLNNLLKENNQLIELIEDNYTDYGFLDKKYQETKRKVYEDARDKIIARYKDDLPEELLSMLRDKDEFIENCNSHYIRGNFIDGFPNNMILDVHYNKIKRKEILDKLNSFLD